MWHVFVCLADALAYFYWRVLAHLPAPQSTSAHVDPWFSLSALFLPIFLSDCFFFFSQLWGGKHCFGWIWTLCLLKGFTMLICEKTAGFIQPYIVCVWVCLFSPSMWPELTVQFIRKHDLTHFIVMLFSTSLSHIINPSPSTTHRISRIIWTPVKNITRLSAFGNIRDRHIIHTHVKFIIKTILTYTQSSHHFVNQFVLFLPFIYPSPLCFFHSSWHSDSH